ncbi:MAG: T9SS type A sorting domain-containing protein [Candidatus Cloacimonetes bacterium]|nr:T9SS type A sorting domain-containing protein [Candidatus Cloacimonadota bacterium]
MRALMILSFLLLWTAGWGLQFETGSGLDVTRIERENEAYYHTGEDDRHFYFTYEYAADHRWAVKYDFRTYYSNIDTLYFAPQSVWVYLPNPTVSGNLTVGLYEPAVVGPGELIIENAISPSNLIAGWNEVELAAASDTLFWLVVNYPTGLGNSQYVSGSNGDGTHSYFWDPYYGAEGSWRNMSANGFNNEFLFSLTGEFTFINIDLEIADLLLDGTFAPGEEIIPRAILHNNSAVNVDSITVIFKKEFPGDTRNDTLTIAGIEAGADIEIDLAEMGGVSYILSDSPGQYKFTVTLNCESDAQFTNNSLMIERNTFNFEQTRIFIENMVELEDTYTNGIWLRQSEMTDYQLLPINYFPNYQDVIYYNSLAEERFHYYQIYNLPATVISGNPLIGYNANAYPAQLLSHCEAISEKNSFVEISEIEALVDTLENVHVTVTLSTGLNQILPSLAANCEIFGMIYEEGLILNDQFNGKVFLDTLQFAIPDLVTLANSGTATKRTVFNQLYKFTPIGGDLADCRLLFWVQNTEDNMVWATAELSFADFGIVDNTEDEIEPVRNFYAYPNPFNLKSSLQIQVPETLSRGVVQMNIYNIRGQVIRRPAAGEQAWDGRDLGGREVVNGIYFMQISHSQGSDWLKIMVIK